VGFQRIRPNRRGSDRHGGSIFELAFSRSADCDTTLHCSRYLSNRHTGQRRRIGPTPINNKYGNGTVADDGRYAALWN